MYIRITALVLAARACLAPAVSGRTPESALSDSSGWGRGEGAAKRRGAEGQGGRHEYRAM
jgi:hypothetical protein